MIDIFGTVAAIGAADRRTSGKWGGLGRLGAGGHADRGAKLSAVGRSRSHRGFAGPGTPCGPPPA